jgi:tripartite-type tricarboxylate transporter receptor subunit TctC
MNVNHSRRKLLNLAAGAAALPALSRIASAQPYPTRPVHVLVGYAAGSAPDVLARLMGQWLSERFGQSFVVDNRPGAGGNLATQAVVRAPPDGYTLLLAGVSDAINATLYEKLNFNFVRDVEPVAGIARTPQVMEVNPSVPAETVPEFITYAKANPGKLSMGSAGNGSPGHVAGELFQMMTGVSMIHVPYRGAPPALTDLLGGQIQVMIASTTASIEHIRAGALRALAVTTAARLDVLPGIPTLAEFIPGYEASGWLGVCAPRNTPTEIVDQLNKAINAGLSDLKMRAQIADFGGVGLPGSPADFGELISDETEKWRKVVKFAGIKPV